MSDAKTTQAGLRSLATLVAGAGDATRAAIMPEVIMALRGAADSLDRRERELAHERQINEILRNAKPVNAYKPNYVLRAAIVVLAIAAFSIGWPFVQWSLLP